MNGQGVDQKAAIGIEAKIRTQDNTWVFLASVIRLVSQKLNLSISIWLDPCHRFQICEALVDFLEAPAKLVMQSPK